MGAWVTVEALRQLRLAHNDATINRLNVVLAAPDIDVDVFSSQMDVIGPLSPPMTVLVSRDDIALSIAKLGASDPGWVCSMLMIREFRKRPSEQICKLSTSPL